MDPSAVITQVAQDSNPDPTDHTSGANTSESLPQEKRKVKVKKKGSKNGSSSDSSLCSFICCFSPRRSSVKSNVGLSIDQVDDGGRATSGHSSAKGKPLLPERKPEHKAKKCIVIDLDETLVHSSFKPISNADFIVPVEIDGTIHQVYVLKRPHVDEFLVKMGELYECVLFTASLAKYADPVTDLLDKWDVFDSRLFRESCVFHRGNYVKDLGRIGRELKHIIIVDNSPASYIFHPENAVPVSSWFDDMNDHELLDLIPFLESLSKADSVYEPLKAKFKPNNTNGASNANNASESLKNS